jgi:cytochrome b561
VSDGAPAAATATAPRRWRLSIRLLHWAMAALLVFLVAIGLAMTWLRTDLGTSFWLYQQHKSWGLVVLPLVALRLSERMRGAPPWPASIGRAERIAATAIRTLFYALMIALPITGWLTASSSPLSMPTRPFGWFTLPPLVAPDAATFAVLQGAHAWLAWALVAATALHVAGALKHALVDRDGTANRIGFDRSNHRMHR